MEVALESPGLSVCHLVTKKSFVSVANCVGLMLPKVPFSSGMISNEAASTWFPELSNTFPELVEI